MPKEAKHTDAERRKKVIKVGITITGPSGSGKSTLEKMLGENGGFEKLISTTSREQRAGEKEGQDYFYVSATEFLGMLERGEMVEHVEFPLGSQRFYGVSKAECERAFREGKPFVVVCEPNGAGQFIEFAKREGWELITCYIDSPVETLVQRLTGRLEGELVETARACAAAVQFNAATPSDVDMSQYMSLQQAVGVENCEGLDITGPFDLMIEQIKTLRDIYSMRIKNMREKELQWRDAIDYDLRFEYFDEDTEVDVINAICAKVTEAIGIKGEAV